MLLAPPHSPKPPRLPAQPPLPRARLPLRSASPVRPLPPNVRCLKAGQEEFPREASAGRIMDRAAGGWNTAINVLPAPTARSITRGRMFGLTYPLTVTEPLRATATRPIRAMATVFRLQPWSFARRHQWFIFPRILDWAAWDTSARAIGGASAAIMAQSAAAGDTTTGVSRL